MTYISTLPWQRKIGAFALGLLTSLVVAWMGFALLFEIAAVKRFADLVDGYVYDTLFSSRQTPPKELVLIDVQTPADTVNRQQCAELIDGLRQAGARAIGFDICFTTRRLQAQADEHLVASTAAADNVIHAFRLTSEDEQGGAENAELMRYALHLPIMPQDGDCQKARGAGLPFTELLAASKDMAHVSFAPDDELSGLHFPLILGLGKGLYPGLPLQMVRRFYGVKDDHFAIHFGSHPCDDVHADDFILLQGDGTRSLKIPVDRYGRVLINFIAPARLESYKLLDVLQWLRDRRDATLFNDKMVLVVNSKNAEDKSTRNPWGEFLPNWMMHASVISQIINQQFITEYDGISTTMLVFMAALMLLGWLVLMEIRFAWIKQLTWLVLLTVCVLLLAVVAIKLYWGHWTGWVLPSLSLCAGYLSAKFYLAHTPPPVLELPQYEDFDLHVQKKDETTYLVDVTGSPAGEEAEGEFSLDLEALAKTLYELRTFGVGGEELKAFGATLFNALFQPQIHSRYDESLGIISGSGLKRLRLKLWIEPAVLSTLPWEFLYDPKRREYLALSDKLSIVRFLMIPRPITPLAVKPPLKVLVAISSPANYPPLEVEKEKERITTALRPLMKQRRMQVDVSERTTMATLRAKLDAGYHVLHFIGHGSFTGSNYENEGCLVFENETGMGELVNAGRLKLLLNNTAVRLVILNACETAETSNLDYFVGVAPMLVSGGIPAVIAMQFKIPDHSAVLFAEKLYQSLAQNYQVDAAVEAARKALALEYGLERLDWGMPVLFMRAPDGILFKASME
ncbi:CHAT domain-containing protein [candidate division KSB1 bacterium]|nr:CHAT domain-containing protein [candidate division KSB1 bacterium]